MKNKALNRFAIVCLGLLLNLICLNTRAQGGTNAKTGVSDTDVIAAIHAANISIVEFETLWAKPSNQRREFNKALLDTFQDPKFQDPKISNLGQCEAAYCLGELRASEAANVLGAKISLALNTGKRSLIYYNFPNPEITEHPVMHALIKIGNPSIPAVIRNLAESDDAKVRELSLTALYHIDGDKDITQLRLQKALKAEKDLQKQARLQAALKSLSEIK